MTSDFLLFQKQVMTGPQEDKIVQNDSSAWYKLFSGSRTAGKNLQNLQKTTLKGY